MASFQIQPPEKFDFKTPEKWEQWARRFERFRLSSKLNEDSEEAQVNTLIYSMGPEAEEILTSFRLSFDESNKYDTVMTKFYRFFIVKRNVIFERARFNSRKQESHESVDVFITALYNLAEHCAYKNLKDEMIRDRIVVGLQDGKLSMKLQLDSELTLQSAITQARQSEAVKLQQDAIRNNFSSEVKVEAVKNKPKHKWQNVNTNINAQKGKGYRPASHNTSRESASNSQCHRCGGNSHFKSKCPAKDAVCHCCKKTGHYSSVCRKSKSVREVIEEEEESFLGSITSSPEVLETTENLSNKPWMVDVKVCNQCVKFKIDTGADVSLIPESSFREIKKNSDVTLSVPDKNLTGVGDYQMKVCGHFVAQMTWEDQSARQKVYVVKDTELNTPLLGRPAVNALKLVRKDARLDAVSSTDKAQFIKNYPQVFTGLGNTQQEYKIELKPDAKPFALSTPRRIPIPLMQPVKEELQRMEDLGVISPITEPTNWCAGIVVIPKPQNKVRICVDLTKLNESVRRENHALPSIEETLGQIAGARYFTKLDANSGFYQVPLAKESSSLTTFITPFGRYKFNRLPFGITSAPEVFQRQMSQVLAGIQGVPCQMDDILITGKTLEEHNSRLHAVLDRVSSAGITLNLDKCEFAKRQVKFLGFIVDELGIHPDPDKVTAITEMDEPTSISELRRFFGMLNFLSKFSPNLAEKSKPLRDLLKADSAWCWDTPQQKAFRDLKKEISSARVLAHYDSTKCTKVSADASSYGLGAVLLQKHEESWRPVAFASRALTPTEQKYAQIEKEALATTWACEKFSTYLIGMKFSIETDHKPLISLLGSKELDLLPPRIQRFRMRLMRFSYVITYVPGKTLVLADTLSRAPVAHVPSQPEEEFMQETTAYVNFVMKNIPATETCLDEIRSELQLDEVCWPHISKLPGAVKHYFPFRHELSVENGLLLRGSRLVIPTSMRLKMFDKLHTGHQGIVKCRERAKISVWWPGLSKQLKDLVDNCTECIKHRINPPEPLLPTEFPDRPWQRVGSDLFTLNNSNYLLLVDYYSRFIEVSKITSTTSECVINHMKSLFARHGIPEVLMSDNGPQYSSSAFQQFASEYRFTHITSSPTFPQSNGEAERAVRTVKSLLKKESDPYLALLAYRSTPLQNGYSPSELLMGRRLRTTVPVIPETLNPKIPDVKTLRQNESEFKAKAKLNFDSRHRAKTLNDLHPGQVVWSKDIGKSVVQQKLDYPRSYIVESPSGSYRRNRQQMIAMSTPTDKSVSPTTTRSSKADHSSNTTTSSTPPRSSGTFTRSGRRVVPPTRLDL